METGARLIAELKMITHVVVAHQLLLQVVHIREQYRLQ